MFVHNFGLNSWSFTTSLDSGVILANVTALSVAMLNVVAPLLLFE